MMFGEDGGTGSPVEPSNTATAVRATACRSGSKEEGAVTFCAKLMRVPLSKETGDSLRGVPLLS